ncbi:hypothetical protein CDD82_7840 [Ophiocordyceps australis]|uniref:EamA domain-containing protein n=1 Tax=Ophiocordyceps australis TaxID=1399860 RepID=A0A2C5YUM2_9HYPO|nr:hypothetical protein CDD82_7840 [Ophiocordyceps australis]
MTIEHPSNHHKGGFGQSVIASRSEPEAVASSNTQASDDVTQESSDDALDAGRGLDILESRSSHWYSYLVTRNFWLLLLIGQVLALCITATNTFTSFLAEAHFNAPAFQSLLNYALLAILFNTLFLVRDGPRAWYKAARADGWRYLIMAFLDVEGNYFTVLAYQYTTILSAQLLNFWSIVVVVSTSFLFLRVRYRWCQFVGILVACAGMGILLASDHIQNRNGGPAENAVKGDLFGLLGASLYGASNVLEEYLVSRRPMHHVLAFITLLGVIISAVHAAIFDRHALAHAPWSQSSVPAYLVGYTLCLSLFYILAPLILRMGSAAFFDISLLTANFWGVIIGVRVFGYVIHFLYPIAFVCIVSGLVVYFLSGSVLGDSRKPWLGQNQEAGVAGIGTAKRRAILAARAAPAEP